MVRTEEELHECLGICYVIFRGLMESYSSGNSCLCFLFFSSFFFSTLFLVISFVWHSGFFFSPAMYHLRVSRILREYRCRFLVLVPPASTPCHSGCSFRWTLNKISKSRAAEVVSCLKAECVLIESSYFPACCADYYHLNTWSWMCWKHELKRGTWHPDLVLSALRILQ